MHPYLFAFRLTRGFRLILAMLYCLLLATTTVQAIESAEEISVEIEDTELSLLRFVAEGEHLIILVSPGFGDQRRSYEIARSISRLGIEVWHIDLAESLFLPQSTGTLRALDGSYVAALVSAAHSQTGKHITLMTRSYAALPVLRGARLWQAQASMLHAGKTDVLTGAILFSPELYSEIPSLGLDPVYDPIATSTNIPIMLYQSGRRGNRWQLDKTLENLQSGGAAVYFRLLPDVTGVFYSQDTAAETLTLLETLPQDIVRVVDMLERIPTPLTVNAMTASAVSNKSSVDITLKPFAGEMAPVAIDLTQVSGERFTRKDFKGKVTVVNFWASWCGPCVEEIPALNRLREHMQAKAFELISINYAEKPEQVREFLDSVQVDFPVLLDRDGSYTARWNVLVYPATFVIDTDGVIVYGVNGAIEWDSPEIISRLEALLVE